MKLMLSIAILLITLSVQGQQKPSAQQVKQQREKLSGLVSNELLIPKGKADQVMLLITGSAEKMMEVARNKTLTRAEKDSRCKQLAAERNAGIASLLSSEQVKQLKVVMANHRLNLATIPAK